MQITEEHNAGNIRITASFPLEANTFGTALSPPTGCHRTHLATLLCTSYVRTTCSKSSRTRVSEGEHKKEAEKKSEDEHSPDPCAEESRVQLGFRERSNRLFAEEARLWLSQDMRIFL